MLAGRSPGPSARLAVRNVHHPERAWLPALVTACAAAGGLSASRKPTLGGSPPVARRVCPVTSANTAKLVNDFHSSTWALF